MKRDKKDGFLFFVARRGPTQRGDEALSQQQQQQGKLLLLLLPPCAATPGGGQSRQQQQQQQQQQQLWRPCSQPTAGAFRAKRERATPAPPRACRVQTKGKTPPTATKTTLYFNLTKCEWCSWWYFLKAVAIGTTSGQLDAKERIRL